jgi:hypothetical protein
MLRNSTGSETRSPEAPVTSLDWDWVMGLD